MTLPSSSSIKKIVYLFLLFTGIKLMAQDTIAYKDTGIKFIQGFGAMLPTGKYNSESTAGFSTNTGLELDITPHFAGRLDYEASRLEYNSSFPFNGINYKITDNANVGIISLLGMYKKSFLTPKFSVYAGGGVGITLLSAPLPDFNTSTQVLTLNKDKGQYLHLKGIIGFEYKFSRFFILYSEMSYILLPKETIVSDNKIQLLSIQFLGFKTAL